MCPPGRIARAGRRATRRLRSPALAALALGLACAATCGTAHAHARLERSTPAAGAVLTVPPVAVELSFNELLDDEFNDITVFRAKPDGTPADGSSFATAKPTVDEADRTRLTTALAPLSPGAYVVQWRVLSRDGHSARGRVLFRVGAAE